MPQFHATLLTNSYQSAKNKVIQPRGLQCYAAGLTAMLVALIILILLTLVVVWDDANTS